MGFPKISMCVHTRLAAEIMMMMMMIIIIIIIIITYQDIMKVRKCRKQPHWALRTYFRRC
jgi:hypothetical protein